MCKLRGITVHQKGATLHLGGRMLQQKVGTSDIRGRTLHLLARVAWLGGAMSDLRGATSDPEGGSSEAGGFDVGAFCCDVGLPRVAVPPKRVAVFGCGDAVWLVRRAHARMRRGDGARRLEGRKTPAIFLPAVSDGKMSCLGWDRL